MKIAILGMGAFGIALAKAFHKNDNKVVLWTKFEDEAESVKLRRENTAMLKGVKIPEDIEITTNLEDTLNQAKIVVLAVPTAAVREVARDISNFVTESQVICIVSKGIEKSSNMLLSDVVYEETKSNNICFLTGPSFAVELAKYDNEGLGFVVASKSEIASMAVKVCLENENIQINTTQDIRGAQLCSATKNVFAILLGVVDANIKSESTKAAVFTYILNDLRMIVEILGGNFYTVFSVAGIGDLILTCNSEKSRNYSFGKYIGKGLSIDEAIKKLNINTVEGLYTLDTLIKLLEEKEIQINSLKLLYDILYRNENVKNILRRIK